MRSQPLVSLGPSGLSTTLGPRPSAGSMPPVHEIRATASSGCPRRVHSPRLSRALAGAAPASPGSRAFDAAAVAREHEPAADHRRLGDDVGVGDPPGDGPVGLDRERLELAPGGSRGAAATRRTGRAAASPSDGIQRARAGPGVEPVAVEAVLHDQLARGVPELRGRLVVDRRGEAHRPARPPGRRRGARRDTARRAPSETSGPEIDQLAADLGQGEDRRRLAGAAPAPARPQAARDRRSSRRAARALTRAPSGRSRSTGGSSAIGATWASASIRRIAGATGKTAVGSPAAAQTVSYRPSSGSMITRVRRACPNGGMPPIVKPVSSSASRAVARRTSRRPTTAASRSRSTRSAPETRHTIGSSSPSSPVETKTSDFTIWPSSAPTTRAASAAVWVESGKVDLEGHALPGGDIEHPLDGGVLEGGRHGGEDSIGRTG